MFLSYLMFVFRVILLLVIILTIRNVDRRGREEKIKEDFYLGRCFCCR